ncbi:MAG: membrane protein insertion efficiency factor YidD [Planctomycetota bacterium]|nr:membrane protein insertion efficiency factor YidD [Planctomycetota bacterium]
MNRAARWTRALARLPAEGLVLLVRLYQLTLSRFLGGHCRFEPSCSRYFIQALRTRGAVIGTGLGVWRLLRCHPFSRGGYDPVPPRRR